MGWKILCFIRGASSVTHSWSLSDYSPLMSGEYSESHQMWVTDDVRVRKHAKNYRNHIFLPNYLHQDLYILSYINFDFFLQWGWLHYIQLFSYNWTNYFRHFPDLSKKLVIAFLSHLYLLNNWLFVKFTWFNYLSSNFPANESISSFVSFIYCHVNPFIDRFKGDGCLRYKDSVH